MSNQIFEKTCTGPCGRTLPLSEFNLRATGKDGHRNQCRECHGAQRTAWEQSPAIKVRRRKQRSARDTKKRQIEHETREHLAIERGDVLATKKCSGTCGRVLPLTSFDFTTGKSGGRRSKCKFCRNVEQRERQQANPEPTKEWRRKNRVVNGDTIRAKERRRNATPAIREQRSAMSKRWRDNLRLEVIGAYGGHCQCCGITDIFCLTLDHVNSDGAEHRKQIGASNSWTRLYQWAKDNGYPPSLRCLCLNCNRAAFYNGGTCPHQQEFSIVGMAMQLQPALAA